MELLSNEVSCLILPNYKNESYMKKNNGKVKEKEEEEEEKEEEEEEEDRTIKNQNKIYILPLLSDDLVVPFPVYLSNDEMISENEHQLIIINRKNPHEILFQCPFLHPITATFFIDKFHPEIRHKLLFKLW